MAEKTFLLVNRRSGKALQATGLDNGRVVEQSDITCSDAQLWSSVTLQGKQVKLKNKAASKVLDVVNGGTENGTWAQTWEDVAGTSQAWLLENASRGYKKLRSMQSGKVLDVRDLSDENGAAAQLWDDVGGENQEWKVVAYPATEIKTEVKSTASKKKPEPKVVERVAPKKGEGEKKPAPAKKATAKTVTKTAVKATAAKAEKKVK